MGPLPLSWGMVDICKMKSRVESHHYISLYSGSEVCLCISSIEEYGWVLRFPPNCSPCLSGHMAVPRFVSKSNVNPHRENGVGVVWATSAPLADKNIAWFELLFIFLRAGKWIWQWPHFDQKVKGKTLSTSTRFVKVLLDCWNWLSGWTRRKDIGIFNG